MDICSRSKSWISRKSLGHVTVCTIDVVIFLANSQRINSRDCDTNSSDRVMQATGRRKTRTYTRQDAVEPVQDVLLDWHDDARSLQALANLHPKDDEERRRTGWRATFVALRHNARFESRRNAVSQTRGAPLVYVVTSTVKLVNRNSSPLVCCCTCTGVASVGCRASICPSARKACANQQTSLQKATSDCPWLGEHPSRNLRSFVPAAKTEHDTRGQTSHHEPSFTPQVP